MVADAEPQRISVSHETLRAELAELKLAFRQDLGIMDANWRDRFDTLKREISGMPAETAGMKARIADNSDAIDELQKSDKKWSALSAAISTGLASFFAWLMSRQ